VVSLGQELRRLREARGLTQDQIAKAVGHAKPGKVSLWENDERRPSRTNLTRLAEVLGVAPDHLRQFGQAYDPTAPRMTRRQRALVEEVATATAPTGQAREFFLSHSHGDTPEPMRALMNELMTDGPEMLRIVGPRGMATVWRLVSVIQRHESHRETLIPAIEAFLADIDATTPTP